MNAFLRLIPVGLLMWGTLWSGAGTRPAVAAENAMTQLVSHVKAVGPGQWVGWDEHTPSALYEFRTGEKPQALGKLPSAPLDMAVGNGRVLWVGSGYRAVAPLTQLNQVKVSSVEGEWDTAVGNARGFLTKDGAKLLFSRDGEKWQPVANPDIDEATSITGMTASADQFALLLEQHAGLEEADSDYVYSIIAVSADGLKWGNAYFSEPNPGEPELTMLGYGHGRWMAMGVGSSYTSTDGREWTPSPVDRDAMPELRGAMITTGGDEWWAIDWRDQFEFSPDGLDWSAKAQSLYGMKGAGPIWVVGPEGMRNLDLDGQGKLRVKRLGAPMTSVVDLPSTSAAPAVAGIEYIQFGSELKKPSAVTAANGVYAVADSNGAVYFSKDAVKWYQAIVDRDVPLKWVRHDGERWVAASRDGRITLSEDGNTWSEFFKSMASLDTAILWRGRYWKSHQMVLGVRSEYYELGRYDQGVDEKFKEWDGQLTRPYAPTFFWRQGGRLHTVRKDGFSYVTDNGDYWAMTRGFWTSNARGIFAAEGNGRVVSFIIQDPANGARPLAYVQAGDELPEKRDTEFTTVTGLAYGQGRFVVLAETEADSKPAFFESTDGLTWQQVGQSRAGLSDLVFGQGGFVATVPSNLLARYQPAALPEKPMPAIESVPVPDFIFKDFGTNFVGSGKRRREIPKTPDQQKIDELRPIAQLAWKGDVAAKVELAFQILEERYALSNPWRAELSFKEGIAAGVPTAARGYAELLQKWKPATAGTTLAGLYRQSAEKGDGASMAWLALNLRSAAGGAQAEIERWRDAALAADPKFADRWAKYELLDANLPQAREGNYAAIVKVLPVLVEGDIRPADWSEALKLADLAAADGQQEPSVFLVNQYQKDYELITAKSGFEKKDYQRLIERGVAAKYKPIVALYLENLMTGRFGYATNEKLALSEAMKLAEEGDADGMFFTAMILGNSRGEQKDEAAAKEWMQKAAAAGHAVAQRWMKQHAAQQPK